MNDHRRRMLHMRLEEILYSRRKSIKEILNGYNIEIDVSYSVLSEFNEKVFDNFSISCVCYQWTGNGEMLSIPSPQACLQIQMILCSLGEMDNTST